MIPPPVWSAIGRRLTDVSLAYGQHTGGGMSQRVLATLVVVALLLPYELSGATDATQEYRHVFGICWRGEPSENLRFARQMGYRYVCYQRGMERLPEAEGMLFYVQKPEQIALPITPTLDRTTSYSPQDQQRYERYFAWKSREPFPNNLATGWFFATHRYSLVADLQQEAVLNELIETIIARVKQVERPEQHFLLAGFAWDVPDLSGDFWVDAQGKKRRVSLAHWTGKDSGLVHPGITHEYETHSDARAEFYQRLRRRAEAAFGRPMRFIMEPTDPYGDWVSRVEPRADAKELIGDFILQEGSGTAFVDDSRIFASGLLTPDRLGSTTPNIGDVRGNIILAGKAAIRGAWFGWFGRFGGTGTMPDYQHVRDVPNWLTLIRVIPNWDNLAGVPLSERSWDGTTYQSPMSFADAYIISSRHPQTNKLFVVFLDRSGRLTLKPGETVVSVQRTDGMWMASDEGRAEIEIADQEIRATKATRLNTGYLLTITTAP